MDDTYFRNGSEETQRDTLGYEPFDYVYDFETDTDNDTYCITETGSSEYGRIS